MNTDKIYKVDFNRLVYWLAPNKIKQPRIINWIRSLVYAIGLLYNSFVQFRKAKLYQLLITPQVCYLEKMLNDRFDFTNRGIFIDDAKDKAPLYIFRRDELKPKYIYRRIENKPVYIYTRGESGTIKDDFIVFVPIQLRVNRPEMISLIKQYKLAGTKFKIQTFGR